RASWGGGPGARRLDRSRGRARRPPRSRFFLSQGQLQGLGAGTQEPVAEWELGLAEGALLVGHEAAGDGEQLIAEGLAEFGGQLLGAGFLLRGQRCRRPEGLRGRGGISGEGRR